MAKNAEEIGKYVFKAADELLLDTNVWFFVHGPHRPGDARAAAYSGAFAKIVAAKSRVYIDVLIVSEFVNAYARLKHNILKDRPGVPQDFKRFRMTGAFKAIAHDIAADLHKVMSSCSCVETGFASLDIGLLISDYEQGTSDFNDLVLAELCKTRGLKLVTDDGDFDGKGVTVLTANKRLLV